MNTKMGHGVMILFFNLLLLFSELKFSIADDILNDAETISRVCSVFCSGPILEGVQMAQLYDDSKTFVDMPLLVDPEEALAAWSPTFTLDEIQTFVSTYFADVGSELIPAVPSDWKEEPPLLSRIDNETWKTFAYDLNNIWLDLYREMDSSVFDNPQRYSILRRRNGLVLPGGRFRETYYWDSYWIVRGLILSGMKDTAQGVTQNLLDDVTDFGFVPNGGRAYYTNRSQPPFLSLMVKDITRAKALGEDDDWSSFLSQAIPTLETELSFWNNHRNVQACGNLSHYDSKSTQPRPESYVEDVNTAEESVYDDIYAQLCAGAETGWDFSTRWITPEQETGLPLSSSRLPLRDKSSQRQANRDITRTNTEEEDDDKEDSGESDDNEEGDDAMDDFISSLYFELPNIATTSIVPIDLNSILYRAQLALAWLYELEARELIAKTNTDDSIVSEWLQVDERCLIDIQLNMKSSPFSSSSSFSPCSDVSYSTLSILSSNSLAHITQALIRRTSIEEFLWIPKEGRWVDGLLSWNNSKFEHYYENDDKLINKENKENEDEIILRRSSGDVCSPILQGDYNNVNAISGFSAPLWAGLGNNMTLDEKQFLLDTFNSIGLFQLGGVRTTVVDEDQGGQQWDSPNAWAPLQMMLVHGLEHIGEMDTANLLASRWLLSNLKGWSNGEGSMFEKYDAFHPGEYGGGGEYKPQSGFGWTNGVALELIERNYATGGSTL